jgi:hypothetical protein
MGTVSRHQHFCLCVLISVSGLLSLMSRSRRSTFSVSDGGSLGQNALVPHLLALWASFLFQTSWSIDTHPPCTANSTCVLSPCWLVWYLLSGECYARVTAKGGETMSSQLANAMAQLTPEERKAAAADLLRSFPHLCTER